MNTVSEAMRRAVQLLALLLALLAGAAQALPAVDRTVTPLAAATLDPSLAPPEAAADLGVEPADDRRTGSSDGPADDPLGTASSISLSAAYGRGTSRRIAAESRLAGSGGRAYRARAPPPA